MVNEKEKLKVVGTYCKEFRMEILGLTLSEFEQATGTNIKTTSTFENGRSSNITHLFKYISLCSTKGNKEKFIKGLNKILGGM